MGANSVGQIFTASGAQIGVVAEQAGGKLVLSEAPGARHAPRNDMVPAVFVEKRLLFAGQPARPAAVKVNHPVTIAFDGVLRRDYPRALEASRLG